MKKLFKCGATLIVPVLLMVSLAGGCRAETKRRPSVPSSKLQQKVSLDGLDLTLTLPKGKFQQGKNIEMKSALTNTSSSVRTLVFSSGQKFDFKVTDSSGREVWRWSQGKFFTMALEKLVLKEGQSQVYSASWDQKDSQGRQVPVGVYLISGYLKAQGLDKKVQVEVEIVK